MAPQLYEVREQNRRRDWFDGTTWFDPAEIDPRTGKRRSAGQRLSDSFNGLPGIRNRDYRNQPQAPDTVHLMPDEDYPPMPYTPTSRPGPEISTPKNPYMSTPKTPYSSTPKTLPYTPTPRTRERSTTVESSGVKSSPHLYTTRRLLGLHPTAPVTDEHNEASHSQLMWPKIRLALREPFAEFWGTFTLVLFGDGAVAQVLLSTGQTNAPGGNGFGDYLSISWGFGLGLMLGIYVAGDSGAYLNPAATFTNCLLRKLPWRRFPVYLAAQLAGAFAAAGVIYANYISAINNYEGVGIRTSPPSTTATAGIFATYPQPFTTKVQQFFQEFLGSAILMFVIFALQDTSNNGVTKGMNFFPLALFFLMFGISTCFGWQTGFAINPARDLGPRLMTAAAGYSNVWTAGDYYFWIPIVAPFFGCASGGILYDLFIYTGPSPINTPWFGFYDFFHPRRAVKQRLAEQKQEGAV